MIRSRSKSRNRSKQRAAAHLSTTLEKTLVAYAAAASAAGVGTLALASPAEAKIVYTPAALHLVPNSTLNLDLNHDGINDFKLYDTFSGGSHSTYGGMLNGKPLNQGNAVWGTGKYASALAAGVRIGPPGQFQTGHNLMVKNDYRCSSTCNYGTQGPWGNATGRYLGFKFVINGKTHYGWARLNVTCTSRGPYALLTGYAYETVANKPIVTGQTKGADAAEVTNSGQASPAPFLVPEPARGLGLLAQGFKGLGIWRNIDATSGANSPTGGVR
jgi:hypothetical protein